MRANTIQSRKSRAKAKAKKAELEEALRRATSKTPDNVIQMRSGTSTSKTASVDDDDSYLIPKWQPRSMDDIGRVEQSVITQCASIDESQQNPAMVMNARAMARIMDDQRQSSQHASASRQLHTILVALCGSTSEQKDKRKTGSRGKRLGEIADMTRVRRIANGR